MAQSNPTTNAPTDLGPIRVDKVADHGGRFGGLAGHVVRVGGRWVAPAAVLVDEAGEQAPIGHGQLQ